MEVNEIHKFLVCAHDINLLRDNTDTVEKNTETQLNAAKEVTLTLIQRRHADTLLGSNCEIGDCTVSKHLEF
jgi:hypothetical protein